MESNISAPSPLGKGDILLVDDTPNNLRLLSAFLTEQGYKVRSVISGAMALTAIESSPPDLILLDINMPDMNGYQVTEHLKSRPATKEIPIIFISALDETIDKVRAFTVGGVDYITKPFQFEEVLVRVETHLTLHRLQKQLSDSNLALEDRVRERTAQLQDLNSAYERFVPREFLTHLDKKSITDVNLGDQVQQDMTIMFTDIRDFTAISEEMTPQENINFLNAYLGCISPVIREHGGFIDKYLGDGIMAIFPGDPDDAVRAAIAMQAALDEFNLTSGFPPIKIGTGLHTGEMMIGIIGEEERMQSTVIADAVNLASRLENMTKFFGVSLILSNQTMLGLRQPNDFQMRCMDHVRVKGKRAPMMVYEIFDNDAPDERQKKSTNKAAFEQGMSLYHEKKFAEASVQFNAVLQSHPADRAAKIYLERAARYMVQGVPGDWDGVEPIPGGNYLTEISV